MQRRKDHKGRVLKDGEVYRKSGLSGRAALSAYFLEGLLLPGGEPPESK